MATRSLGCLFVKYGVYFAFILRSFFHDQIKPSFLWTYFVFLRPEKIQLWTRDWLNVDQFKKEKNHATSHDFF